MKFEGFAVYSVSGYSQIAVLCKWFENFKQRVHEYVEKQKQKSGKCLLKTKEFRDFVVGVKVVCFHNSRVLDQVRICHLHAKS